MTFTAHVFPQFALGVAQKRPLHQNALDAYLRGALQPLGRATTIRPESDYEQDLSQAERWELSP